MAATLSRRAKHRRSPGTSAIAGAYGLLYLVLAGYFLLVFAGWDDHSTLIDGWGVDAIDLAGSALCLIRAFTIRKGRLVVFLIGSSLLMWSLGDIVLTFESLGGAEPSVPSAADAFYIGYFPVAYVAIASLIHSETRFMARSSWLDGLIAGLGAAAVCAAFAFHDVLRLTGGNALETAVNLSYPVGDLVLLVLIAAGTVVLGAWRRPAWLLLACGVAINVTGDTFALVGTSTLATNIDSVAWPTAIALMSGAMWMPRSRIDPVGEQKPPSLLLPACGTLAALVIVTLAGINGTMHVALGLAVATLLLAAVRLGRTTLQLRELTQLHYRQAVTDHLTGLGNRRHLFAVLYARLSQPTADDPQTAEQTALLYIDLDNFKELNDSFGHPAGDEVLRRVADRFKSCLRERDALFRVGGDEFAVVSSRATEAEAVRSAERLTAALSDPFALDAVRTHLGASIGIAMAPRDARDSDGLLWCADAAMFRAKASAQPLAVYEAPRDYNQGGNRLKIADQLKTALASPEQSLILHYQPQLSLTTGEVEAVEALVRWPHPSLGLLAPLTFLPIAEEAGLMGELTDCVLRSALRQCRVWRDAGRELNVAVNISTANLVEARFCKRVGELLAECDLPADALVLELTETSIIRDFERSQAVIERLAGMGIVVSVDDFGAGFTSLAYLERLAIGELKLDRTLLMRRGARESDRAAGLVRATIELGHALGLRVIAEGIEDRAMVDRLREFGCDTAQGFFIQPPVPAAEVVLDRRPLQGEEEPGLAVGSRPAALLDGTAATPRARRRLRTGTSVG